MDVSHHLLLDTDPQSSRMLFAQKQFSDLVAAGANTRHLLLQMSSNHIKDFCYCDFNNEISVIELVNYAAKFHQVQGVLVFESAYRNGSAQFRALVNALHPRRVLINDLQQNCELSLIEEPFKRNHLSLMDNEQRLAHLHS